MSITLTPPAAPLDHDVRTRAAQSTATALEAAAHEGALHGWVADLDLPGRRVGHLVLNPAGAFAVESSWHDESFTAPVIAALHAETVDAGATARSVLHHRGVHVDVRAVVAVWGAAQDEVPAGGVATAEALVIRGRELVDFLRWSATFGGAMSYTQATDLLLDLNDIPASDRVLTTR